MGKDEKADGGPDQQTERKNGEKNGRKRARGFASSGDLASSFDIKAPKLDKRIAAAAMRSGGYPYDKKMKRKTYEKTLRALQTELLKAMDWTHKTGARVAVVFEGRDAAGKGGAIATMTAHLNPRTARIVALPKPTEREQGQWYFQRYVSELPTRGEVVLFDRSWYNRAGVEAVFGFCTPEQTAAFLREAPVLETMLARDGLYLIKFFLTIGAEMQMERLHARWHDPLKRWKLSDLDFKAIEKWDAYSACYERILAQTDVDGARWTVVRGNDKRRARLETIRHVLSVLPYPDKDVDLIAGSDSDIVLTARDFLEAGGEVEHVNGAS